MKKHLSFWEEHCDVKTFQSWCGDFNVPFKNRIRNEIKEAGYKSVLDCGAGVFSEYYGFKNDGYEVSYTGVEITPSFIEFGKSKGIKCFLSSINQMPFEDNQFEATICLDVLNHQLDYQDAIKEMLRVTKNVIFISFFKPFAEEATFKESISNWDKSRIKENENGIILQRYKDSNENAVCIYNHFFINRMSDFLDTLDVEHSLETMSKTHGEEIKVLRLKK